MPVEKKHAGSFWTCSVKISKEKKRSSSMKSRLLFNGAGWSYVLQFLQLRQDEWIDTNSDVNIL